MERRRGSLESPAMAELSKTAADQISEISKLVADAQDKLDQVVRALRTVEDRLKQADPNSPSR
jgi:uncharacterized coiled-coil protein SlyX